MLQMPAWARTPYSDVHDDAGYQTTTCTLAEFTLGLDAVLARFAADMRTGVLIVELGPTPSMVATGDCAVGVCLRGYVQWLVTDDGLATCEVSSDQSLDPAHWLSGRQTAALRRLGWLAPDDECPNWRRPVASREDIVSSSVPVLDTIRDVFDGADGERLRVKMAIERW